MAIFSRVFLASGLRNRPSRQDGSRPSSKEEPQRAQAGAGDRRPQSKNFLPDWKRRYQMSWILGLYSYQNIDNKGQKWTQITSRFTVFIDKKKYSKLSVTSLFPYSLNKKSQIFSTTFSNRVFHELRKIFFLYIFFPR